jgi:photosystem II stability/assembly factor-like uncharacterized protein
LIVLLLIVSKYYSGVFMSAFRNFAVLFLCINFICIVNLHAQWIQTSGPSGGVVSSITFVQNGDGGTTVLAGLRSGGVFYSADSGNSWTASNKGLENTYKNVQAMVLSSDSSNSSNTLLISVNGDVYRSTDYGFNWTATTLMDANINAMIVLNHKNTGNTIIASGGNGTYRSTDNGTTWSPTNCTSIADMQIFTSMYNTSGNQIIFGTSGSYGVYSSTDDGLNWASPQNELTHQYMTSLAVVGNEVFAGTSSVLYRSTDYGNTWSVVKTGLDSPNIHSLATIHDSTSGQSLLMFNGSSVYRTTDAGNSWALISSTFPGTANSLKAFVENDTSIYTGSCFGGIYHSTDAGRSWQALNKGLVPLTVNTLISYSDNSGAKEIYAGTQENGVFRTTDNGDNWDLISAGLTNYKVYALLALRRNDGGKNLFAGTYGGGIFLSTDNGISWNTSNIRLTDFNVMALTAAVNNAGDTSLFAGTATGIYRSTDYGATWYAVNSGFNGWVVNRFVVYPNDTGGQNILAGADNYQLYLSTNYGNSWTAVDSGIVGSVYEIASCTSPSGSTSLYTATDNGVFLSTDNAVSWKQINTRTAYAMAVISPYMFTGGDNSSMTFSTDNGNTWSYADTLPVKAGITSLLTDGKYVYAAPYQKGVWRRPIREIVNGIQIDKPHAMPASYSLKQNYPNPFNPTTVIEYSVPERTHVQLLVFNTLGQKVSELVNEEKNAGSYRATFTASHLTSGVYFYTIRAAGYTETKKLMLVK